MKIIINFFATFLLLINLQVVFAQKLEKIHDMDFYSFSDIDKKYSILDYGISISCARGMMKELVDYVSVFGDVVKDKKTGDYYCSDSGRFIVANLMTEKFLIEIYNTKEDNQLQTIKTSKKVDEILKDHGYKIKKGVLVNNSFSHRIVDIQAMGDNLLISVNSYSGSVYVETKFMLNINHPDEIFPIVPKFPELNDDAAPDEQSWSLLKFDTDLQLFIYARVYKIKNGSEKGKSAIAIAQFDTKLNLVKTFDLNNLLDDIKVKKESIFNHIVYTDAKYFYLHNLSDLDNKSKSGKVLIIKKFDINGKEVWHQSDFDKAYDNYNHFFSSASEFNEKESSFDYVFRNHLTDYANKFNDANGKLLKREVKKVKVSTYDHDHEDVDDPKLLKLINEELATKDYKELKKVYYFPKQKHYLIILKAKGRHYTIFKY